MSDVEVPIPFPDRRPFFTRASLARYLAVDERTVTNLLTGPHPVIPSYKFGRSRRISAVDVDAYVKRCADDGREAA